jgi:phytoene dehydrogenase-like protein
MEEAKREHDWRQKNLFKASRRSIDKAMTVIVGAGLAGLTCAKVLAGAGRPFVLLEASDRPGGRVVSDRTRDGFVLDRGFQVLLDSYPAARRHLDFAALGGGRFRSGAMFVGRGEPRVLENPVRSPRAVFGALLGGILPVADQVRLAGLVMRVAAGAPHHDVTTEEFLRSCGFSEEFFVRLARPFFGGVLLDPSLGTSARLFAGYLRRFVTGRALLPAAGMGGIGAQLASGLPRAAVHYGRPVAGILREREAAAGVVMEDGSRVRGDHIVLAVDEPAVCRLLGKGRPRPALGTAVHYFCAARPFYRGAWLCLPPRREESPVLHAALVSNVSSALAPEGSHLWSVTVCPEHPRAADAEFVAREVAAWFRADPAALVPVDFVRVPYAVPGQPPGCADRPPSWGALPAKLTVAGDAVAGASIEAVMAGGETAAKKVISSGRLS